MWALVQMFFHFDCSKHWYVPVVGKMSCGVCFRNMAQCLMSIFRLTTTPEDIVVLHMCNILETQVALLIHYQ